MSASGKSQKQKRYERLHEQVKSAEQAGDLPRALETWRELGEISYWFVQEKGDESKRSVLEKARRRVPELERIKQEQTEDSENSNGEGGEEWREESDKSEVGEDDWQEDGELPEDRIGRSDKSGSDSSEVSGFYEHIDTDHDFSDIGGMDDEKKDLTKKVKKPFEDPERYENLVPYTLKGVLLHGPPGTGKTYISKALANEVDAEFLYVRGSNIVDKYVGESEKNVRRLIEKAKELQPCIVFVDELDTLAKKRGSENNRTGHDEMLNELLSRIEELGSDHVVVIGTTNQPWILDEAAVRSGRFEQHVYIGLPDVRDRVQILRQMLSDLSTDSTVTQSFVRELATKAANYTAADLESVITEAGLRAGDDDRDSISAEDLKHGFGEVEVTVDMRKWGPVEEGEIDPQDLVGEGSVHA